tara:strand:- start:14465 stop:14788 length:324 start_codon:yes stop_codon:yes gene_type:complete
VQVQETEAGAATEATITGLPNKGRVLNQLCTKASGTASTVAPILVTAAAASAAVQTVCQATAASDQSNAFDDDSRYHIANGTLYHRTVCDAGSDNTVTTIYFIQAGW